MNSKLVGLAAIAACLSLATSCASDPPLETVSQPAPTLTTTTSTLTPVSEPTSGAGPTNTELIADPDATPLGPVDVATYCRDAFESSVSLRTGRYEPDAAFDNWHCAPGGVIDFDKACARQYGDGAIGRVTSPDDATTWRCYKP